MVKREFLGPSPSKLSRTLLKLDVELAQDLNDRVGLAAPSRGSLAFDVSCKLGKSQ